MSEYTLKIDIITPDGRRLAGSVVVPEDMISTWRIEEIDLLRLKGEVLLEQITKTLYDEKVGIENE